MTRVLAFAEPSAVLILLPWQAATKCCHYRGMSGGVADVTRAKSFENTLMFARDPGRESRQRIECLLAGRVARGIDAAALPAGRVVIDPDTQMVPACAPDPGRQAVAR
jgi:hypothetical protein